MGLQSSPLSTSRTSLSSQSEIPYRLNILKIHCRYWKWDLTEVSFSGLCWQLGNPSRWHLGSCGRSRWVEPATANPFAPHCPPTLSPGLEVGAGEFTSECCNDGKKWPAIASYEGYGGLWAKKCHWALQTAKGQEKDYLREPRKEHSPANIASRPTRPTWGFWLPVLWENYYAFFFFKLFIYFWLHCLYFAACRLSLVAAGKGFSSCRAQASCDGFLFRSTGSRVHGLQLSYLTGSAAPWHVGS